MKRHLVMDLFHGKKTEDDGDWIPFINPNQLEKNKDKVKVKLSNGIECFAYFYRDKSPILGYAAESFWECSTRAPLTNVTHFKYLKEKEE